MNLSSDNTIINKISSLERCMRRVKSLYQNDEKFLHDYNNQDAIILNLQRACEQALKLGMRVLKLKNLSIPSSYKEIFQLLNKEGIIDAELSENLANMVGFRNIAVHDYQELDLNKILEILKTDFIDFQKLIKAILK